MAPGQNLVQIPLPAGIEIRVDSGLFKGLVVCFLAKLILPGIELRPVFARIVEHIAKPAVSSGKNCLQIGERRIVIAVFHAAHAQLFL